MNTFGNAYADQFSTWTGVADRDVRLEKLALVA